MGLAGALGALLLVSLGFALVSLRTIEGAVPGGEPVLGMAATGDGFLVGTAAGVFASPDGVQWSMLEQFPEGALVAQSGSQLFVLSDGSLYRGSDLGTFDRIATGLPDALALAADRTGRVWLGGENELTILNPGAGRRTVEFDEGPTGMVALAIDDSRSDALYAGGLSSGLWYSEDGGSSWERLIGTPVRAALVSGPEPVRFVGTAGGILSSTPERSWEFTGLRLPVEALARSEEAFFAMTTDRLLYRSEDGTDWEAVAAD